MAAVCLTHVLVQVGDQILRFEVELDRFPAFGGLFTLVGFGGLGHDDGGRQLDAAAEFFRQKVAQFLLEFLGVGYFFA